MFFSKAIDFIKAQRYALSVTLKNTKDKVMNSFTPKRQKQHQPWHTRRDIIGLALVFTVVSIAYSSYIVWFGTTGVVPKVMIAPQMVLAAGLVIWKFTK